MNDLPPVDTEAVSRFLEIVKAGPLPASNSFELLPDLQGFFSDAEAVFLARVATDEDVFEVGSWKGRSTVFAALTARLVVALDWWRGDAYAGPGWFWPEFEANVERYGVDDKVVPIRGRFQSTLELVNLAAFGVLHYDADHDEQPTEAALSAFLGRARADAVLLVHDCNYPTVRAIVDEASRSSGRSFHLVDRLGVLLPNTQNAERRFLDAVGDL